MKVIDTKSYDTTYGEEKNCSLYKPGWARQRHGWFLVLPSRILLVAGREGMFGCQIFIRHILVLPVLLILVQYVLNRVAVEPV